MIFSEEAQLCMYCGLCCQGYFLKYAEIYSQEDLNLANKMGCTILENTEKHQSFALPCPKFDGICSVYPERPSVCDNYQCELLKSLITKDMNLTKAKKIVDEMKKLCLHITDQLDRIVPQKNQLFSSLKERMKPLLCSDKSTDQTFRKNNPSLFLDYATFIMLLDRYFDHRAQDYIYKIN